MLIELSGQTLILLFFTACLAGFIDAVAGGGGLLTLPALLLTGLTPVAALATNKLQALAGSLSASCSMMHKRLVDPRPIKTALLIAFCASAAGTVLVQLSPPHILQIIIPLLIAAVGLYTLFSPNLGQTRQTAKISQKIWQKTVVPLIGFYDGYLGPGTGTFFTLCNTVLRGMDLIQATAAAKVLNLATNLASVFFFILGGQVYWTIGLVMMTGQCIGALAGSRAAVRGGAAFIRPMIVSMCFFMVVRYTFASFS